MIEISVVGDHTGNRFASEGEGLRMQPYPPLHPKGGGFGCEYSIRAKSTLPFFQSIDVECCEGVQMFHLNQLTHGMLQRRRDFSFNQQIDTWNVAKAS